MNEEIRDQVVGNVLHHIEEEAELAEEFWPGNEDEAREVFKKIAEVIKNTI